MLVFRSKTHPGFFEDAAASPASLPHLCEKWFQGIRGPLAFSSCGDWNLDTTNANTQKGRKYKRSEQPTASGKCHLKLLKPGKEATIRTVSQRVFPALRQGHLHLQAVTLTCGAQSDRWSPILQLGLLLGRGGGVMGGWVPPMVPPRSHPTSSAQPLPSFLDVASWDPPHHFQPQGKPPMERYSGEIRMHELPQAPRMRIRMGIRWAHHPCIA